MSQSKPQPVPPAGRSDKGPGGVAQEGAASDIARPEGPERDQSKQGSAGNINRNTKHKGYQQDR